MLKIIENGSPLYVLHRYALRDEEYSDIQKNRGTCCQFVAETISQELEEFSNEIFASESVVESRLRRKSFGKTLRISQLTTSAK